MNKPFIVSTLVISLFLSACAAPLPSKQTGGAVLGGVLGGIAGTQIGKGKGRTAAVIAGTLLGALIGGSVGATMDASDQLQANRTLETVPDGQPVAWTNPNTNAQYEVTPTKTYDTKMGTCREYQTVAMIEGQREVIYGKACRQPDGSWKMVE